jgi:1,4-dihydroxy-2-naphthoate octaprenyltransferase
VNPSAEAPRSGLGIWVAGARPRTLYASVSPVVVGTAAAINPTPARALASLVVAVALQVGVNYANDYFDGIRSVDTHARVGPMRLTASGAASPGAVRAAAAAAFGVGAVVGLWLALTTNPWLLVPGAAALLAAVLYSGGPRPYGAHGMGEASVFVFFGLFATAGTAYVQGGGVPAAAWCGATGLGLLAAAILVANNLRDIGTDTEGGKRTLAVRIGDARTRVAYQVLVAGAYVAVGVGIVASWLPVAAALAFLSAPGGVWLGRRASHARGRDLVPVLAGTAQLEFAFAVLLAAGLAAARIW